MVIVTVFISLSSIRSEFTKYLNTKYPDLSFKVSSTKIDFIYGRYYANVTSLNDGISFPITKDFKMKLVYRKNFNGCYEFAIFQRADNELWWQGICGGVEEGETIESGARRETFEEAGISDKLPLYRLDTESYLPANIFHTQTQVIWGKDIVVIPMYFFAMPFEGIIKISDEHKEFRWLTYEEAEKLVYFHDQKTALWEVKERLLRGNLIR